MKKRNLTEALFNVHNLFVKQELFIVRSSPFYNEKQRGKRNVDNNLPGYEKLLVVVSQSILGKDQILMGFISIY